MYKGYTIQPYSPAAGTGLSSHELNQPGCYRDVKDTTCTAQFKIKEFKNVKLEEEWGTAYFLAWTTTPWTLAANSALCVGPKIEYVSVQSYNPYTGEPITVIMAEARLSAYFNEAGKDADLNSYKKGDKVIPWKVTGHFMGTELEGMEYEQLIPGIKPMTDGAFRVILGDYVTTEDGTGIVHIAPNFGADDAFVAKKAGVPPIVLIDKKGAERPVVDLEGKYYLLEELDDAFVEKYVNKDLWNKYAGRYVKNAYDDTLTDKDETLDITLCMDLKAENKAFKIEKHVHNYPHCWRTDKPVLYYPLDSWFIKSTEKKDRMFELNKTINWKPESTGTGRFGNWLENLNDWNLSRSRFWGTPLPIWRDEDGNEICIGSVEELYNEVEKSVAAGIMATNPLKENGFVPGNYAQENYDKIDLHRPYVDNIILVSKSGKPMKRETDLIDVWFDSGSMPYAQIHYPFENSEKIDKRLAFPADFINEGVDQTRGWFFTLHAIATMVFDSIAFKNVISTGLVLDSKGNKMSKHVGNVVNPFDMMDKYGSDAVRFYMMTNSEPWDNLKFDPNGVDEIRRKFFGTLYNTYSFFALYANVDDYNPYSPIKVDYSAAPEIDRWILSKVNSLVKNVEKELEDYDPTRAGRLIDSFVNDDLSNWYVRLNRKRFWGKEMSDDKLSAYQTLHTCLMTVAKLLAPLAPFYADQLYLDLGGQKESVHLDDFPVVDETYIDTELETRMEMAQKITSMVLALRKKVNMKVKQPLKSLMIPAVDDAQRNAIELVSNIILDEVNVKELNFADDGAGMLVKKVKCNFRTMGKKFGKLMKGVAAAVAELTQEQIAELETNGSITVQAEGQDAVVELADVEVISEDIPGWLVSNEGNLTVALEIELTDELRQEGLARELINRIQNIRKDTGLDITDRIMVVVSPNEQMNAAIENFGDYIKTQVLANTIEIADNDGVETEFDDFTLNVKVTKA